MRKRNKRLMIWQESLKKGKKLTTGTNELVIIEGHSQKEMKKR